MTVKKKKPHVAERLLPLLAKRLREVHREKNPAVGFNFNHWWYAPLADSGTSSERRCGTVACAAGHACLIREFQKRGLRIDYRSGIMRWFGLPCADNISAMASCLDIPYFHAAFLFMPCTRCPWGRRYAPNDSATALQVARHIERYVAERGWEHP